MVQIHHPPASAQRHGIRWVDDDQYPRTWQGIYDALVTSPPSGLNKVVIAPGPAISFSTSPATGGYIPIPANSELDGNNVEITGAANANPVYFTFNGSGPVGTARALSGDTTKGQWFAPISTANIGNLVNDGLAVGGFIRVFQDDGSGGTGADQSVHRVWAIDSGGGAVYVSPSIPKVYLAVTSNAKAQVWTPIENIHLKNLRFDGASINQANIFIASYFSARCSVENVVGKNFYGQLMWNENDSFSMRVRNLKTYNGDIGISQIGAINLGMMNSSSVQDIEIHAGGWGLRMDSPRDTTIRNVQGFGCNGRIVRILHPRRCTGFGFITHGSYGTGATAGHSGFTAGGDMEDCDFEGIDSNDNYEAGILLTHVLGSPYTIKNNHIAGRAKNNGVADLAISGAFDPTNTYDVEGTVFLDESA